MLKEMPYLELKTKIDFRYPSIFIGRGLSFNYDIPLLLKDGTILLYNSNTISFFTKDLELKLLYSFESNIKEKENEINIIRNIKQLKCGDIVCCNKNLYIFNIKSKIISPKIIKLPNGENIFDIIELRNKKLLGITSNSIIEINKKEEEYEINCISKIQEKYIEMPKNEKEKNNNTYIQYLNMYDLLNNRLLIHSYSTQLIYGRCGTHPPGELCLNKIFILDLNKNEIINYFEPFDEEANIIILDKYICISNYNIIKIYDIFNYKLLQTIKDKFFKDYIIKYDDNIIIGISNREADNDIILYNLLNINDIKYIIYRGNFMKFKEIKYNFAYTVRRCKNKTICILNNNLIFIACHGKAFIVEIKEKLNLINFHPLNEIEYTKEEIKQMESIEYIYI